jgi:sugar phosphate isomerase/epimerase
MKYFLEHHDRITHLHIKDVTAIGGGGAAELGEGVLRIDEMLKTVRDNHDPIAFILERNYISPGSNAVQEIRKQIDWMKSVLDS